MFFPDTFNPGTMNVHVIFEHKGKSHFIPEKINPPEAFDRKTYDLKQDANASVNGNMFRQILDNSENNGMILDKFNKAQELDELTKAEDLDKIT